MIPDQTTLLHTNKIYYFISLLTANNWNLLEFMCHSYVKFLQETAKVSKSGRHLYQHSLLELPRFSPALAVT